MRGDPGPYMNDEGDVWVPRTVPYLQARRVAKAGAQYDDRLVYVGREDAALLGFLRDCRCDEVCEEANRCRICQAEEGMCVCPEPDLIDWDYCHVPAWRFKLVEA